MTAVRWRLRASLTALIVTASLLVMALTILLVLVHRLPAIDADADRAAANAVEDGGRVLDHLLGELERSLSPLVRLLELGDLDGARRYLSDFAAPGWRFSDVYVAGPDGRLLFGLTRAPDGGLMEIDAVWSIDGSPLFQLARHSSGFRWQEARLSVVSGAATVSLAAAGGDHVIVGELRIEALLEDFRRLLATAVYPLIVVDGRGDWLLDTLGDPGLRSHSWAHHPALEAVWHGRPMPARAVLFDRPVRPVAAMQEKLFWIVLSGAPVGMANPEYRNTVSLVSVAFLISAVIALVLGPIWATTLERPLRRLVGLSRAVAGGDYRPAQDDFRIAEFEALAQDMRAAAVAIEARERKLLLIFNASPVPMCVSMDDGGEVYFAQINNAFERTFGYEPAQVAGRNGLELGIWVDANARRAFLARVRAEGIVAGVEARMRARDGHVMLCALSASLAETENRSAIIMVIEDVTEARCMQDELAALNAELETRVEARTRALGEVNAELGRTVASLERAQAQLVQAETLAALGRLVAGVAHEMNTPIGNALMALSTLSESLSAFRDEVARGLRRSVLGEFLEGVEAGLEISERNMHKAGELVASFKQVAVDQTSLQRRRFLLEEIVSETMVTLHPTLKRTPFAIEVELSDALEFDSYPGPLGQVLTNLINNAVTHAFEGRSHGRIRLSARRTEDGCAVICVADDGIGIAPEMRKRVFEPFFTTRMGRGGTGLGLHIVHASVTQVLGGRIGIVDAPGWGTTFELVLPLRAPFRSVAQSDAESVPQSAHTGDSNEAAR